MKSGLHVVVGIIINGILMAGCQTEISVFQPEQVLKTPTVVINSPSVVPVPTSTPPPVIQPTPSPKPSPTVDDDLKRPLFLNFYSEAVQPLSGVNAHIQAVIMTYPVNGTIVDEGISNAEGDIKLQAYPGFPYKVTASKTGFTTRVAFISVHPGEGVGSLSGHSNTIIFGPKPSMWQTAVALALSTKPELQRIEYQTQSNRVRGFKLFFSEPIERQSIETQLVIRKSSIPEPSRPPLFIKDTTEEIVFRPTDFAWTWNKEQTEVIAQLLPEKTFPPEPPLPRFQLDPPKLNQYQLSFTALSQMPELKDLNGESRPSPFFVRQPIGPQERSSYFTNALIFPAQQNP